MNKSVEQLREDKAFAVRYLTESNCTLQYPLHCSTVRCSTGCPRA